MLFQGHNQLLLQVLDDLIRLKQLLGHLLLLSEDLWSVHHGLQLLLLLQQLLTEELKVGDLEVNIGNGRRHARQLQLQQGHLLVQLLLLKELVPQLRIAGKGKLRLSRDDWVSQCQHSRLGCWPRYLCADITSAGRCLQHCSVRLCLAGEEIGLGWLLPAIAAGTRVVWH